LTKLYKKLSQLS